MAVQHRRDGHIWRLSAMPRHSQKEGKIDDKIHERFMGINVIFFQHIIAINYSLIIQVQLSCS
jgi:hypothetical protein